MATLPGPEFMITGDILFAIAMALMIPMVPIFWIYRKEPVLRHRNWILETLYFLAVMSMIVRFYYIIYKLKDGLSYTTCAGLVWLSGLHTQLWALSVAIRAIRLYFIFNITKYKLETEADDSKKDISKPFWADPKWITTPYLLLIFAGIWAVFIICFPTSVSIWFATHFGGITQAACAGSVAGRITNAASIGALIVLLCFIAWTLRDVHDAYFIKDELKYLACSLIVIIPAFIWTFFPNSPGGWHLSIVSLIVTIVISFNIPGYLAWKSSKDNSLSSTISGEEMSDSIEKTGSKSSEVKVAEPTYKAFKDYPKVAAFMKDPTGLPYLQKYLLHYQDIPMSNTLMLWTNIIKFKEIKEQTSLVAKAWIMCQKFINEGCYIQVDCVPNEMKSHISNRVAGAIAEHVTIEVNVDQSKSEATSPNPIDTHIFDEVLDIVENKLAEELFRSFFKSQFYKEHQKASALSNGLNNLP